MSELMNHPIAYKLVRNFVIGLLAISAASIIINILIAQDAYAVSQLSQEVSQLKETLATSEAQLNAMANPALLSQKAETLGMIIPETSQVTMIVVK